MRVESTTGSTNAAPAANLAGGTNDFMTLLVAQLQAQDPLSPMNPSEFMSQLAQLQSVTELQAIRGLLGEQAGASLTDAASLLGRTVEWRDAATGEVQRGAVERVSISEGSLVLTVGDVPLASEDILSVSN